MRRVIVLAALLVVAVSAFAQVVVYQDTAELAWDAVTTDADGNPLLAGDTVSYDVYFYDLDNPPMDVQDIAALQYAGTTDQTALTVLFPERRRWVVGVRSTITDGGGTPGIPSPVSWSTDAGVVDVATMGGPFYYTPLVESGTAPQNLGDQRY